MVIYKRYKLYYYMDKYGLIGYPLKHSFSQGYFNEKFNSEQIDSEYINFEIAQITEFKQIIKNNPNLKGLNVTIPYKEKIIPYLDELSANAKEIGAVNVIKFIRNKGKLKLAGHNSDIVGFKQSIEPLLKEHHKKALILGTGGSAKAIYHGLRQLGLGAVFASRDKLKDVFLYKELDEKIMHECAVIVNCTPVGMFPNVDECPPIPYEYLTPQHLLYDLLYNPDETLFLKSGKSKGATVKNGLEMLLLQAFVSWEIWTS